MWPHYVHHTLHSAGDVTIPGGMTLTVDSDLNGESPQFTLTCTSTGGPATTVTWTRDSETVSGGMTVLDDPVTAQYTHTLTVTGRLGGQYQCTVSNNKPSSVTAELIIVTSSRILTTQYHNELFMVLHGLSPCRSPDDLPLSLHLLPHGWWVCLSHLLCHSTWYGEW